MKFRFLFKRNFIILIVCIYNIETTENVSNKKYQISRELRSSPIKNKQKHRLRNQNSVEKAYKFVDIDQNKA